jgi:Na+/phosphate symporter
MTVTNQELKTQLREAIEAAQTEVEHCSGYNSRLPQSGARDTALNHWAYMVDLLVDIEGAADALCEVVEND